MKKKPNRKPNQNCLICGAPFYAAPSAKRSTCSLACRTEHYRHLGTLLTGAKTGPLNPRWKGGRCLHQGGRYVLVLRPDHPHADRHGYIREHRLVMEGHLGRLLGPKEVVHHVDGNGQNNAIENLRLYGSNSQHLSEELTGRPSRY